MTAAILQIAFGVLVFLSLIGVLNWLPVLAWIIVGLTAVRVVCLILGGLILVKRLG